ncbi:ABC transporter, putative [Ixodes scapularis]|uniref:ABC transporter, putative n=1 Tax=Ixodes scapularis TaxID=6945 RepID=B7Q3L8_IXOSC|nr:ABC transporter, putative [Ixodes scapularis]|eukprot:XP_002411316.1 ABC transporter, putative [Ixodes scapularis]
MVENGCLGESERLGKVSLEPNMRNVKERKSLVSNLSGVARPGTLTAIMGSSGAGKTTLLNILTGFYDDSYEGEVQVNGYVRDRQLFNRQSCYVMQEDRLLPVLTVQEALTMSADLRLPTLTKREKANVVAAPLRFAGYVAFAILLIALFYNIGRKATMVIHTAKMYFTVIAILYFQSLIPTVIVFPIEVLVLLRENRNSWYSINTYYLANYLAELPFLTVPVIMFIALIYYPTAQPLEVWRAAGVMLFSVQLASVVQSMGLMVSAVAKLQTAVYVAIPVVSPSFIFGGFCVQDRLLQPWVRWLTSLSPCNYAYHGILLSVYGYDREPLDCDDDFLCLYERPEDFLEFTGSSGKKLHVLSLALLLFDVVFRLLALVLLRWRLSKRE